MEKFGIEIKWAALITLSLCGWNYVEKMMGWHDDFSMVIASILIQFLILIVLMFFAFIDKKRNAFANQWTFMQAFKFGLFLTGLLTIFSPLAQYIIYQSISPDYFSNIIEYQLAKGKYTKESLLEIHNIDLKIREGVTNTLSIGVIFTALFAFVLKNKNSENESKQHTSNKTLR